MKVRLALWMRYLSGLIDLSGLKVFVVGSGAIGCELLKTFALMGVAEQAHHGDDTGGGGAGSWQQLLHGKPLAHHARGARSGALGAQLGKPNIQMMIWDDDFREFCRPMSIGDVKSNASARRIFADV